MNKLTLEKISNKLFYFYAVLFIISTFNRELKPFDLDLRFVLLPIALFIVFYNLFRQKKDRLEFSKLEINIIIFYIFIVVCNIIPYLTGENFSIVEVFKLLVLHVYNFIAITVFYFNKKKLDQNFINKIIYISIIILFISMICLLLNIPLNNIMSSKYSGIVGGPENTNLFGLNYRIAGFAQDPNYTALFFIITFLTLIYDKSLSVYKKMIFIVIIFLGLSLSWSRTVVLALPLSVFAGFILEKITAIFTNKNKDNFNHIVYYLVPFSLFLIIYLFPFDIFEISSATLSNRFMMWHHAKDLFQLHPFLGNGLGSFRIYFDNLGYWMVQTHSMYWEIMTQTGIVGIILFSNIIYSNFSPKNQKNRILIFLLLIFGLMFEVSYLQVFVLFIYLNYILEERKEIMGKDSSKRILFFVNSFGQGGAERVCINLAEGYLKLGYTIDFITLYNENKYKINDNFNVYCLNMDRKSTKLKRIIGVFKSIYKVNQFICNREKEGSYALITSHLPFSNIITRLSIVSKRSIYVMHISCSTFQIFNEFVYRNILKFVFNQRYIVSVSNGVKDEMINKYGFDPKYQCTIYNPILVNDIYEKKIETIDYGPKYFLFVGRLIKQKRVDRLIEVFKKGEFYKKYRLVIVGNGDEEIFIKKLVKDKHVSEYVEFIGWQDNVYKWMANAQLLLSTSDFEAFPMGLIEAFASGCKVVSANCEFGPSEILIGPYKKYLVNDINDIDEYIEKINIALLGYPEPSDNPIILQCKIDNVLNDYLNFYQTI